MATIESRCGILPFVVHRLLPKIRHYRKCSRATITIGAKFGIRNATAGGQTVRQKLCFSQDLHQRVPAPSEMKLMTDRGGLLACGFNNHLTSATVRIFDKNYEKRRNQAEIKSIKKTEIAARNDKDGQRKVKVEKSVDEETQVTAEDQNKETFKNTVEQYQHILTFPETSVVSCL